VTAAAVTGGRVDHPPMISTYVFDDAWAAERDRIGSLERMLDPGTESLLTELGVGPGWRCLEVGAGAGSTTRWLADRVGPDGHVLATDTQTTFLEPLRGPTVDVLRHDMCTEPPPATGLDLVHVRWMLHWPAARRDALRTMVACLRPGGVLLAEEPVVVTAFEGSVDPVVGPVLTAAIGLLQEMAGGMDAAYGRRLFHDMNAEGLVDLHSAGRTHVLRGGDAGSGATWLRHTVEKVRDRIPGRDGVTAQDVAHVLDLLDDPDFAMLAPTTLAVRGRRPA
jgi:SAM-dependent methyltransferase